MGLRTRLALAMTVAAVLPMIVLAGLPLLRAARAARDEAEAALQLARRQAAFVIDRHRRDVASRVERAAWELGRDLESLRRATEGPEDAARGVARSLAERCGLDEIEILGGGDVVLAASRASGSAGRPGALAGAGDDEIVALPLEGEARGPSPVLAFWTRRSVLSAGEALAVGGARIAGEDLARDVAEITGRPAALVGAEGQVIARTGEEAPDAGWISSDVPLGGGWAVRVSAPPGDVRQQRRDLFEAFAGIAPFALASALAVGILMAEGISRPIRALAARADEISARGERFRALDRERDEVRRLTLSFDRMLESLRQSEQQRLSAERIATWQEMARRIAHEVKNPLSPIKLAVDNLRRTREKAPEDFDRALEEETATILEEVESLRRLVDEFSRFARMPRPQPAPCDPVQIVRQALALFSGRIEALGVHVGLDVAGAPRRVLADAEQVGRALKNVLANALDAMETVGERRLDVTLGRGRSRRGETVTIEVRDSGVGFEAETQARIFEPYFTTRPERGGTGLGMAIAHRIVSEHGGTIEARGEPGRGAAVVIRLPVEGPPSREA